MNSITALANQTQIPLQIRQPRDGEPGGLRTVFLDPVHSQLQNVNFNPNCSCRGLNMVLGIPNVALGW